MHVGIVNDYKNSPQFGNMNVQKGGIEVLRLIKQAIGQEGYTNLITKACDIDVVEIAIGKISSNEPYITIKNLKNSDEKPINCLSQFKNNELTNSLVDAFKYAVNKAQEIADGINTKIFNELKPNPSVSEQISMSVINTPKELYTLSEKIIEKGEIIASNDYVPFREMGVDYERSLNSYKYLISNKDGKLYYIFYDWTVNSYTCNQRTYRRHISPKLTLLQMKDGCDKFSKGLPVAKYEATDFADRDGNTKHLITNTIYNSNGLIESAKNLVDGVVVGLHKFKQSARDVSKSYQYNRNYVDQLDYSYMEEFHNIFSKKVKSDCPRVWKLDKFKDIRSYFNKFYYPEEYNIQKMIYENQPNIPKYYHDSSVYMYLDKNDKLKYIGVYCDCDGKSLLRRLVGFDDNNNIKSCKMLAFCKDHILNPKTNDDTRFLIKMPDMLQCEIPAIRPFVVEDFYREGSLIETKIYDDIEGKDILYVGSFDPKLAPTSKTRLHYLPEAFISPVMPDMYHYEYKSYAQRLLPGKDIMCVTEKLWPCKN